MHYKRVVTEKNQLIHIFEINPDKFEIIAVHASMLSKDKATVYSMAKSFGAAIGINGGFFKASRDHKFVSPAGILKIKDKWHGIAYIPRAAIGWSNNDHNNNGRAHTLIDIVDTKTTLHIDDGINYKINIFNPVDIYAKGAIFSHNFFDFFNISGCNLKISNNVVTLVNAKINSIANNEYVFSIEGAETCHITNDQLNKHANLQIDLYPRLNKQHLNDWNKLDYIVGGAPILMYNGKKNVNYRAEIKNNDFINNPHARTAVGILKNNNWVLVVVEQNLPLNLIGMTIPELATFMESLECETALNLDGGGSTSLYTDNKIEREFGIGELSLLQSRPVSDAILIIPRS